MPNYIKRFLRMFSGIALYGCGVYMTIQANLGLSPWDALNMGVANVSGLSFGDAGVIVGGIILVLDVVLNEKIGFGTLVTTVMIGKMVDLFNYIELLPKMNGFLPGVPVGLARGIVEGTALLAGWLLGAKVGIGTPIAVLGIGFIMQAVFRLLRFDPKAVRHEDVVMTVNNIRNRQSLPEN